MHFLHNRQGWKTSDWAKVYRCLDGTVSNTTITTFYYPSPSASENRFSNVFSSHAYLYKSFLNYANKNLAGKTVVISNGDIGFSLQIRNVVPQPRRAFVLSRFQLDCAASPCPNKNDPRSICYDACQMERPWSYDAFVFKSPVEESLAMDANHPQNMQGAENALSRIFENHGIRMWNLCHEVRSYHYHCFRDSVHQPGEEDYYRYPPTGVSACSVEKQEDVDWQCYFPPHKPPSASYSDTQSWDSHTTIKVMEKLN